MRTLRTPETTSAPAPALAFRALSKRFGATQALEDVDLAIGSGEVVALMGANGAGKSTLAKIASGVIAPDRGAIAVDGQEIRPSSPQDAQRAGVVVVHQSTDQLGVAGLTVAENLLLDRLCGGAFAAVVSRRRLRDQAQVVAAAIGLDVALEEDFAVLGPAQRQLVAIARAVAAKARALLFDEPTASLSSAESQRLFEVIDRLRARGVAILYISHRLSDLRRVADRIVILRNGRRVAEQSGPFDFAAAVQAMIGRALTDAEPTAGLGETSDAALSLRSVRLTSAARPFDLDIRAGEVVAVTGALGAGKSRLLRALFGLAPLAGGEIALDGAPWRPSGPADAIVRGVFMAGEDRWRSSLLPPATPGGDIAGLIALPHRKTWFPWGLVDDRRETHAAERVIRALAIRCRGPRDAIDRLSGGNQQKVVIGRWRSAPCRVLLLDEPFQGVDVGTRRDIVDALRADRRHGVTVIATSDVEEAIEVADIVVVMSDHTVVGAHDLRRRGRTSLIAEIAALEAARNSNAQETAA